MLESTHYFVAPMPGYARITIESCRVGLGIGRLPSPSLKRLKGIRTYQIEEREALQAAKRGVDLKYQQHYLPFYNVTLVLKCIFQKPRKHGSCERTRRRGVRGSVC